MKHNVFFTADNHFGHDKIRQYCQRPFATVEEMNQALIENWNSVVSAQDIVYVLGDFSFGHPEQYLSKLYGHVVFIEGNHDRRLLEWARQQKITVHQTLQITIEKEEIFLSHYAHRVWPLSHYGSIHAYGHSHGGLPDYGLSMDVGVDANNFTPVNALDIIAKMKPIREQLLKEGKIFPNKYK
jgi:calcineurin-like phosphoesterase family protein